MAAVYSSRFIGVQSRTSSDPPSQYVVPAGFVAVIKWTSFVVGAVLVPAQASLYGTDGQRILMASTFPDVDQPTTFAWQMSCAFQPLEAFAMVVDTSGTWDFTCSGYLLPSD